MKKTSEKKGNLKPCRDYLGNSYESITAMAAAYGISNGTFFMRQKRGWDLEKALTTPASQGTGVSYRDHKGKEYPSRQALARAYNISYETLRSRLSSGWSMKKALTRPAYGNYPETSRSCEDHKGKRYPTKTAMAEAYGLTCKQLIGRLEKGWSLKDALTKPLKEKKQSQNQ